MDTADGVTSAAGRSAMVAPSPPRLQTIERWLRLHVPLTEPAPRAERGEREQQE